MSVLQVTVLLVAQGFWKTPKAGASYTGVLDAVKKIIVSEKPTGLYRGVTAAMLGSSLSWGIYLPAYVCITTRKINSDLNMSH